MVDNEVDTTIFEDSYKASVHSDLQRRFQSKKRRKIGEKAGITEKQRKTPDFDTDSDQNQVSREKY